MGKYQLPFIRTSPIPIRMELVLLESTAAPDVKHERRNHLQFINV